MVQIDWPWRELPTGATVVDVGGGMGKSTCRSEYCHAETDTMLSGGFCIQLLSAYPHLQCVVQDRAEVVQQARESFWPQTAPELVANGRVQFMEHDFFKPNPVRDADVYWFRGVL
jgi:hypothetical protein